MEIQKTASPTGNEIDNSKKVAEKDVIYKDLYHGINLEIFFNDETLEIVTNYINQFLLN